MQNPLTPEDAYSMGSAIQYLPPVVIEGHQSTPDHPMRVATRRAAGLDADGWTPELRGEVAGFFDALADEWHTRTTPQRKAVVVDALTRGLGPAAVQQGIAIEIGSGALQRGHGARSRGNLRHCDQ